MYNGKIVEFKAVATFPTPVRGKLTDQAFAPVVEGVDPSVTRRAIGDWVSKTLEGAPVGTVVTVVEVVERVVDTYTKRPRLEELIEAGRVAAREFKNLPADRQAVAIREQAISFTFGNMSLHDTGVTRRMVEEEYDRLHGGQAGEKPA